MLINQFKNMGEAIWQVTNSITKFRNDKTKENIKHYNVLVEDTQVLGNLFINLFVKKCI